MFSIIPFFVKAPFNCRSFDLLWSVNARGFKKDDSLHVTVNPELDYECKHTDEVDRSTEIIECVEDIESVYGKLSSLLTSIETSLQQNTVESLQNAYKDKI